MTHIQWKRFDLGDVLSVTTGRLVSSRHMDGVYDILSHMTQADIYTHQIPRALEEVTPVLALLFPALTIEALADELERLERLIASAPAGHNEAVAAVCAQWVDSLRVQHGTTLLVPSIEGMDFSQPVADMMLMLRPDQDMLLLEGEEESL